MSVKRHTAYNLLGSALPMLIGVVTVPIYLRLIGDARYGVLALVWLFLGYFGLFDPGITRAAQFHIARLNGRAQEKERESVFWTALVINLAFGMVGGIVFYLAARPFFMTVFKMPFSMRGEVMQSLPWLAASVPISIATGVLGGALQAREEFGAYNVIYSGNAVATQLVPLVVAYLHGPDLSWLIPTVLLTRLVGVLPSGLVLVRVLPMGKGGGFDGSKLRTLFSYGGWVTITNLINPVLTSMDRMLIGSVLSAEAVTLYTVPFNLVSRFSILPGAFATSLFPKFSHSSREESSQLAGDSVIALAAVITPLIVTAIVLLPLFMRLWVGRSFAVRAAPIGIILLAGIWINSLAVIPYEHLQAIDRPDLTAKFHAFEFVPFLAVLWVGVHFFGLKGAAWAWTLRVSFDAILLFLVAGKTPGWKKMIPGGLLVLVSTTLGSVPILSLRIVLCLGAVVLAAVRSWSVSPMLRRLAVERLAMGRTPVASP